ncbi:MAG: hypothetical protein U0790_23370 [Isosphaeraceae bacterium]
MRPGATPTERFNGWFVRPIEKLEELPEGDGAFAALMIALPLYERYIIAKLKLEDRARGENEIREEMGNDLNLSDHERRIFWDIFRVGFMHQAMGHDGPTKWLVSHKYEALPVFEVIHGQRYVCLDPWKFARRVLDKYREDERLIAASESFPLADVFAI